MAEPDDGKSHKQVYGAGMYAGLRAAGIADPQEYLMNKSRLEQLSKSQTGSAQKVLQATSTERSESINDVCRNLAAKNIHMDFHAVAGYLRTLRERGLVKETATDQFLRITARETTAAPEPEARAGSGKVVSMVTQDNPAPADEPLDRLTRAAIIARELAAQLCKIAAEIEDAALAFEQKVEDIRKDTGKLEQLRSLLKDF